MSTFLNLLAVVAMIAVAIVLVRGLWNMLKGGSGNTSNKLMQLRVILQFIAVIIIVLAVYFGRPS